LKPSSTKADLSRPRQELVELFQRINFGKIEHLRVSEGEPVLDPVPRVIETRKMGASNGPRPEADLQGFCLKSQVIELFVAMDETGDGFVSITVKHGLPFSVEIERTGKG
jgi:hypothetical protein